MFFDFTLTDADVGQALDPQNGFIVNLSLSVPPIPERPAWDPLRRIFTRGFFTLRGEGDGRLPFALRNMISYSPGGNPLAAFGEIWINRSEHYRGKLLVEAVPRGSVWGLTLSDIPNVRAAARDPAWWTDAMKAREDLAPRAA